MAILLVEQYYDFAPLADQYLVMERGEIIKRGAGADMEKDGVRELLAVVAELGWRAATADDSEWLLRARSRLCRIIQL